MKADQKKLEKSQLEITFELTAEEFEKHAEHALLHFKEHVKMDGFRQGQVPSKIIEEKVGQEALMMEAGDLAVKETYHKYILENKLEPVGQPEVQITKIAKGNPFLFKAKISVLPEIELSDYKEIASHATMKEVSVNDKEVEDALNYLQKTRAKLTAKDPLTSSEKGDFVEIEYKSDSINSGKEVEDRFILGEGGFVKGFQENIEGMKAGEEKEFTVKFPGDSAKKELAGKEVGFKVKLKSVQKMELPEIDDEFAKMLGEFQNLTALKKNIKEGITFEKKETERQKTRGEILDKVRQLAEEKNNFEIPEVLVNFEKDRLLNDLKQQISKNVKISFEEYLAAVKQTEAGLKENFSKEAEKRLKNFLVLREIGKKEKIEVSEKEVEEELSKSPKNGKIDREQLKEYTKGAIYNEKVFEKLESFSKIKN
jgi:trigger factor